MAAKRGRSLVEMGGFLTPIFIATAGITGVRPFTLGDRRLSFEPGGRDLALELRVRNLAAEVPGDLGDVYPKVRIV